MSTLPPLYVRLLEARNAFSDFHHYKAPSAALAQSQALVGTVNALINAFVPGLEALGRHATHDEAGAAQVQLESVVEAYILDIREGVDRLEEHTGDSGLGYYTEALKQALGGEIDRVAAGLKAQT